jgi:glycosyltransferase involved in cell wall biosynthesis
MNLLMLSGDSSVAQGKDGAFAQLLGRFRAYWSRIDVLTPSAPGAAPRALYDNVYIHPASVHRALQARFIQHKGHALFAERPYDLITSHDYGFFYNGAGAWQLLRSYPKVPLVSEIHHVEGYPIAETLREKAWLRAARVYIPFAARYVAAFRVVNPHEVPELLRKWGVPEEKILFVPSLYLDLERLRPLPETAKRWDLLFVGRLARNKGLPLLLDVMTHLVRLRPHTTLAIRGDGELAGWLDAEVAARRLQAHITRVPRLEHSDAMAGLYNSARALVCLSTVEGNPRVTAEAMACGIPVASTPVGIMPALIQDGHNGLLLPRDPALWAQRLAALLDDPAGQQRLGEAGRQAVQPYEAQASVRRYAHAYHDLIALYRQR